MIESVFLRLITTAAAVLVFNALWAAILHSQSGRISGIFGSLITVVGIVSLCASQRLRTSVLANPPEFLAHRSRILAIVAPFALPAFFLHAAPVLGFWRFDGRSALLVAWLVSIALAIGFEVGRAAADKAPIKTFLTVAFLLFSAGLWLAIITDSGVGKFMMEVDRRGVRPCQGDPFATMATVWQSHSPSQHLFLGWRSPGDFEQRNVYANHVHPFLLSMYGWMRAARTFGHLTLWQASNTTMLLPVFVLIAAFVALLARSGKLWHRSRVGNLAPVFLAIGILLTTWRLWSDLIRFNTDNPYPLEAGVLILLYAFLLPPVRTRSSAVAAAVFAALSPTNTPMVILPVLCLFGRPGHDARDLLRQNRSVLVICLAALVAGAVSYLEPRVLIRWNGFHAQQSTFLFRSGLDGDTRYFSGLFQAVVAPCPTGCCYTRTLSDLVVPAAIPLMIFAPLVWWWSPSEGRAIGHLFLFLITPYLTSVILFPQSVSIHPYMYDHWFVIPVVVAGLVAMLSRPVEDRLGGAALLIFLLFTGAVMMSNLLGIVQGLSRAMAVFTN